MLEHTSARLRTATIQGARKGIGTWWWLVRMMLPITLTVALLQWCGAIALISQWLTPLFSHIGLTGEGVLVFITGALASIYAAIGVMGTLDMDFRSATIIAVMTLVAHNLIVESIIQRKAGSSAWGTATLRVIAAIAIAWITNLILPANFTGQLLIERSGVSTQSVDFLSLMSLKSIITNWAMTNARLLPLMVAMIVGLNVLQQLLREFRLIEYMVIPLRPLMRLFGLTDNCSFMWVVLNSLGLAYGGAVMISEVEQKRLTQQEARQLNNHAAMSHSLLEDTLLYVAIGIGLGWLLIPRLLLAIVVVWGDRLLIRLLERVPLRTIFRRAN